jgi:outer membrane protein assembly factor BamB
MLTAAPATPETRTLPRRAIQLGTLLAVTGLAVVGLVGADVNWPTVGPVDPAVSLPDAGEVTTSGRLDAEEREAALAPFDPARLACQPAGCEAWRRPIGASWHGSGALAAGQLVVAERERLLSLDVTTGEERWQLPLASELRGEAPDRRAWDEPPPLVAGNDTLVVAVTHHGIQLVSRDGTLGWTAPLPTPAPPEWVEVTDEAIVLLHQPTPDGTGADEGNGELAEPGERDDLHVEEFQPRWHVTVLDARTGTQRWSRQPFEQVFPTVVPGIGLAVQEAGIGRMLDLETGAERFTFPLGDHAWLVAVGDRLVVSEPPRGFERAAPGSSWIIDARAGEVLAEFAGAAIEQHLQVADQLVVLVHRTGRDGGDEGYEAVALGPDGSRTWRQRLEPDTRACCATALDLGAGRVRLASGPTTDPIVVDVSSGSRRDGDPIELEGHPSTVVYQLGPDLLMERPEDGRLASTLHDGAGRRVQLSGRGWPLAPGLPTAARDGTLLLGSDRELLGIRFP